MFHDDVRALTAKKYEILGELELAKAAILREMSSVDKCTLTRLREVLDHYDRLEKSVIEKINTLEVKTNVFISNFEKEHNTFENEIEAIRCLEKEVADIVANREQMFYNSERGVQQLLETALSYHKNADKFVYGNWKGAFNTNCVKNEFGKYEIDCSTFVMLSLMGIPFQNSRYTGNATNIPASGFDFFSMVQDQPADRPLGMLANDIAQYAKLKGYLHELKDDISRLEVGDILFLSSDIESANWENIGHVNIVSHLSPATNEIYCIGATDATPYPIKTEKVVLPASNAKYFARFPLADGSRKATNICTSKPGGLNVTVTEGKKYVIAKTLELTRPLESGKLYSLCLEFESELPDGVSFMVGVYANNSTYASFTFASVPNAREHNATFYVDHVALTGGRENNVLLYLSHDAKSYDVTYNLNVTDIGVYEGFAKRATGDICPDIVKTAGALATTHTITSDAEFEAFVSDLGRAPAWQWNEFLVDALNYTGTKFERGRYAVRSFMYPAGTALFGFAEFNRVSGFAVTFHIGISGGFDTLVFRKVKYAE